MRKIDDLKEVQKILLDNLIYLDKICREHHLKYFMVDGTLLGAVRHQGFIPWDDDIDVWMPREDYDKLAQYVNSDNSPYVFQTPQNVDGFTYSFGKLIDTRTKIEEKIDIRVEMGLFIDVFPYDGLPEPGTRKYQRFLNKSLFLESQRMAALYTWDESKKRRNGSFYGWLTWRIRKWIGCPRIVRLVDKNARKYPVKGSNMVGCLVAGYKKNQMMEREITEELMELEFEGHRFMAPKYYDRYLKKLYGDYMKLPPKEQQIIHHMNNIWWKE